MGIERRVKKPKGEGLVLTGYSQNGVMLKWFASSKLICVQYEAIPWLPNTFHVANLFRYWFRLHSLRVLVIY